MILTVDLICTFVILISLWKIPNNYRWWLVYSFGCFLFIFLRLMVGLPASAGLEIVAMVIGYSNYKRLKK